MFDARRDVVGEPRGVRESEPVRLGDAGDRDRETRRASPVPVVTETDAFDEVVVSGAQAAGFVNASALLRSSATLVLRVCSVVTSDWSVETRVLSLVCGAASSCMSWLMMVVVSSPLESPLMLPSFLLPQEMGVATRRGTRSRWRATSPTPRGDDPVA